MALEGYTTHAALAVGETGGIIPGARADLAVFTVDPLRADPDELADAPIDRGGCDHSSRRYGRMSATRGDA